jgi:hypothetical protein
VPIFIPDVGRLGGLVPAAVVGRGDRLRGELTGERTGDTGGDGGAPDEAGAGNGTTELAGRATRNTTGDCMLRGLSGCD